MLVPALLFSSLSAYAQQPRLNYLPNGATNVTGTYTDLGTTGTVIPTANTDDDNSAAIPIGFSFSYNHSNFTQFVLNTNGLIRLGGSPPSVVDLFLSQDQNATDVDPVTSIDTADINLIMPFNFDLVAGTAPAEYRYATTGAAGSRVTTIQWKNVSDKTGSGTDMAPTQYTNFSFQLKLHEGTNVIEFVYGPATASTNPAASRFPNVGIKGFAENRTVLGNKTTGAAAWSTTVFITGPYTTTTHNFRNATLPDRGRTYRFTPIAVVANDVSVESVFALGSVAPLSGPQSVETIIVNQGTTPKTNLAVTLTVAGATTFTDTHTIATLAAGDTAFFAFAPYTVSATTGTNTVTVSVPADGLASNNTKVYSQTVTPSTLSYLDPTVTNSTTAFGIGQTAQGVFGGYIAALYHTNVATTVSSIKTGFTGAAATGATYKLVIFDADTTQGESIPGNVLYTSATLTRPAAGGNVTTNVPSVAVARGDFFVALMEVGNISGLAVQDEDLLRPATFFLSVDGTMWLPQEDFSFAQYRPALSVILARPTATRNAALTAAMSIYPNPAHHAFTLSLPAIAGERMASVSLLNALGQQVQTRTIELNADGTESTLDVSSLATGIYTLRVQTGSQIATKQIAVQ